MVPNLSKGVGFGSSGLLTDVLALHVVVEGDAVGHADGSRGAAGRGDVVEWRDQAGALARLPWPRRLDVNVVACGKGPVRGHMGGTSGSWS